MNSELIQNLRYKLEKRVSRLELLDHIKYSSALKRFYSFLKSKEIFQGILDELSLLHSKYEEIIQTGPIKDSRKLLDVEDEAELAAIAYFLIQYCANSSDPDQAWTTVCICVGGTFMPDTGVVYFHKLIVQPLCDYIEEQLDDQRAILALLRRYKHKCEWFQRERLYELWEGETKKGEKKLAYNLYEYLHDQGLDFSIEPASASGEIDLIAAQNTDDPLLADAKVFNSDKSKGKSYLAKALNQIYIYTQNYNEPFGYLVIFKTSSENLRFSLTNTSQSTPYITYNNKTIFFIVIDIYNHETSASERGKLKSLDISEGYLIEVIEEDSEEESSQVVADE